MPFIAAPTTKQQSTARTNESIVGPTFRDIVCVSDVLHSMCDGHFAGMELGYKKPVLFERHAVGGEYSAGYKTVGNGRLVTLYLPEDGSTPEIVDGRMLKNSVVIALPIWVARD